MDRGRYVERFRVGSEAYKVVIRESGEVLFHLSVPRTDCFGHDIGAVTLENDSHGRSITIFRRVVELVEKMVYQYRPPLLWLRIECESRRSLYGKLVDAFLKRHPQYISCDEQWQDKLYVVRARIA